MTLKNIKLEKHQAMMEYMVFGSRNPLQTNSRNEQTPTSSTHSRMEDERIDHRDLKGLKQKNHFKQLQTHNLSTDDVENNNSTDKLRDLLFTN